MCIINTTIWPAGWCSWFVTGLVRLKRRARPWPKSVDFHDAENRQRPCRMRYVKRPLNACLAWVLQPKLNSLVQVRIVRAFTCYCLVPSAVTIRFSFVSSPIPCFRFCNLPTNDRGGNLHEKRGRPSLLPKIADPLLRRGDEW
ncbi:hypothetical protein TNCV_67341 [Trichonephila clavipes]|nr:hypothetical protein TNCV_67341 [Trichonephila clavipes]